MPTVLIAAATSLGSIKQRGDFPDAMMFADTDALRALEAITRHRPNLVVLESAFAATSRGTALVNRIKADPALSSCEVRVVPHLTEPGQASTPSPLPPPVPEPIVRVVVPIDPAPPVAGPVTPVASAPATPPAPVVPVLPEAPEVPDTPRRLDTTGTRRVPRHEMPAGVDVQVDGNPATLIDLSVEGAQIVSLTTLKPNQRVRLTLPIGLVPIRVIGEIAWAMFEMPQSGPRYRAGIALIDPDTVAIQRFIDANAK